MRKITFCAPRQLILEKLQLFNVLGAKLHVVVSRFVLKNVVDFLHLRDGKLTASPTTVSKMNTLVPVCRGAS